MTWGISSWGSGIWGGHSEEEPVIEIAEAPRLGSILVLSNSLIEITFNREVANNEALTLASNYVITSTDSSLPPVTVDQVLAVPTPSTSKVYLRIRGTVSGSTYILTAANILSTAGVVLAASGVRAAFLSRPTKADSVLNSFPSLYTTDPTSIVGGILMAIAASDDLIGGTGDRTVPVRIP